MPKRKRKILVGRHHPVKAPDFDWQLIEESYGHSLAQPVRQQIQEVTIEYASDASFELTVAPVADARKEIELILAASKQLRNAIPNLSATCDEGWYARHLLMNHIRDPALPDPTVMPYQDPISVLSRILTSCVAACESSLEELDHPDWSVEVGEAWDRWITRLIPILEAAGLPATARKDDEGIAQPSGFVSLVAKLQGSLPEGCRRHTASDPALAVAINRARDANA